MNYVIIGNSAAAIGCVEGIRQADSEGKITIISSEPHHTYSRPLISYLMLGKTDEQRMKYRDDGFYVENGVTAMLGRTVTSIDAAAGSVVLENGERVAYDKLLVATGSSPFVPPMEGLDKVRRKHSFMKLDDAKELMADLTPDTKVLIIGAGLIGLKCAEGISGRCADITVVDLAPTVLSSILDKDAASMIQTHLEENGLKFRLADSVASFTENSATLKSGETLPFDVLVLAVGVRPNTGLIKDAGGEVGRGVITDAAQKTSIENVYSAGDCTESDDVAAGTRRILAILPNAYMQGETAGINMAGGEKRYASAMPMNAIGFFGLHMVTAGCYEGECYSVCGEKSYKKLFYKDNVLKGFIIIGDISKAGIYTNLIRERIPLDSLDFDLICEYPSLLAFSGEERARKLGGAK